MPTVIASIDQGTTSTRCLYFGTESLAIEGKHQEVHKQIALHPGWLEHDPEEIYRNAIHCINEGYSNLVSNVGDTTIAAIGITNQRETTVAWSRSTGKPLCNAIVWSDVRTQKLVDDFVRTKAKGDAGAYRHICGLPCSTYFSAFKMMWMIEKVPAVAAALDARDLLFGTMDSWLIYRLTGGKTFVTDVTNASRTMLMNIRTLDYDESLLAAFGVPRWALPRICKNDEVVGTLSCPNILHDLHGRPIAGCIGDQQASLFGQMCFAPGDVKSTYGTGCFLLANTGETPQFSSRGLLTTVAFSVGGSDAKPVFALEGSVGGAGSTLQWLRDNLGLFGTPREADALAETVPDTAGVVFVPALGGLLAPHWRPDARGAIVGLTYRATKAHVTRAAFEGIAMRVTEVANIMQADAKLRLSSLRVDGGLVNNSVLMQMQADLLNIDVRVPAMLESTALGAALCAGIGVGVWRSTDEILDVSHRTSKIRRTFSCKITNDERNGRKALWSKGLARSFDWAKL